MRLIRPAVTTIVQPAYDIGYRAAEILLGRIEASELSPEPVMIRLPATLKVRDSSRPPIARRPEYPLENLEGVDRFLA